MALGSAKKKEIVSKSDKEPDEVWATVAKNKKDNLEIDFKKYAGTFKDDWFGTILISEKKGKLYFSSNRSKALIGEIFFYKDNTLVVKWNNRSFNADAFLSFELDGNGNLNVLKMKPISELTDFSYDFQDLNFIKVTP